MSEVMDEEIRRALAAEALAYEPPDHLAAETLAAAEAAGEPGPARRIKGWIEGRKLRRKGGVPKLAFAGMAVAILIGLYGIGFMADPSRQGTGLDRDEQRGASGTAQSEPDVGGHISPDRPSELAVKGGQPPGCEGAACGEMPAAPGAPAGSQGVRQMAPDSAAIGRDGASGEGGGGASDSRLQAQPPAQVQGAEPSTADRVGPGPVPLPGPVPNAAAGPGVIRTGEMEVRVKKGGFGDAWAKATNIAAKHGGFVAGSSADQVKGRLSRGILTVRVPAANLDAAVADFQRLGRLVRLTSSSSDVSGQLIDFDARIRAAQARELQLLELLRQARSVSDSLQVGTALSEVRTEIESLQAQRANLQGQVELASLTVSVYEPQAAPERPKPLDGRLSTAWNRALDAGTLTLSTIVIGAGFVLPLVALGLIIWGGLRLRRRLALR